MNHSLNVSSMDEFIAARVLLGLNQRLSHLTTVCKGTTKHDCSKSAASPSKAKPSKPSKSSKPTSSKTPRKYLSSSASQPKVPPRQIKPSKQYSKALSVVKGDIAQPFVTESPLFSPPSSPESTTKTPATVERPPHYEIQPVVQPLSQTLHGNTASERCALRLEVVSNPCTLPDDPRSRMLRPMKQHAAGQYSISSRQKPMEPVACLIPHPYRIPSPVQPLYPISTPQIESIEREDLRSTLHIAPIQREDTTDSFFSVSVSPPFYPIGTPNHTARAAAPLSPVHPCFPVETEQAGPGNTSALHCISCGCRSTPCWRPSWSEGKLCNPCGLRYSRNHVRCSSLTCSYIPTKTDIGGHKRAKCKKCFSDLIHS